jgi:hypothetical protein
MRLAWSIEIMAVLIGLSIAFARLRDANLEGTANQSFWGSIQLMGGFIIVSMGELTKIPLSMLLVNVRPLFKPLVFLVVAFISAITFETVFLSLERGYSYQKSDIHAYRDQLRAARDRLDTEEERSEIKRIEGQIQAEQSDLKQLGNDHTSNIALIEKRYLGDIDAAKPIEFDNAQSLVLELEAELIKLSSDYQAKLEMLQKEVSTAVSVSDLGGDLGSGTLDQRSPELIALDDSIERLQARKLDLEEELRGKLDRIQADYDSKRTSFQQSIDRANEKGDQKEAERYQGYIVRLAPRTESENVKASLEPQIDDLNLKISETIAEREEVALREARARSSAVSGADAERMQAVDDARRATTERRDVLTREMQTRRDALSKKLAEAKDRLDAVNETWRANRDAYAASSATAKRQEISDEVARYTTVQEEKRAVVAGLRTSQLRLSQAIREAESNAPVIQTEVRKIQRRLCNAVLGNQIFRISKGFDTSGLFGVVRSPEEVALAGKPDPDCPTQIHVDEANADRVAILWFGSVSLLAATAGAATAITAQMFLRMAENLRWQAPAELVSQRGRLSRSLRRALVNWRWRRVKTVEVERIKEVPVEVIKPFETVREVENVIRELVPVPVFVPTGGDVEAEMAKVRSNYEDMNRLAREAALPPQTMIYQDKVPSSPEENQIKQSMVEEFVPAEVEEPGVVDPASSSDPLQRETTVLIPDEALLHGEDSQVGTFKSDVEKTP